MDKVKLALKSRTVWTVVVLFIIHGVTGVHDSIPVAVQPVVDAVLSLLAIYFRVNPKA